MNGLKSIYRFVVLGTVCAVMGGGQTRAAELITNGHYDVNVSFTNGVWDFNWYNFDDGSRIQSKRIDMGVMDQARMTVPASGFSALGAAPGEAVWILPQVSSPPITFLGYRTEDLDASAFFSFGGNAFLDLKVLEVRGSGPDRGGYFTAYQQAGLGAPDFQFTSANGLDNGDAVTVPMGAHAHYSWAFTKPGEYQVTFEGSGVTNFSGGRTTGSGALTFFVPGGMTNLHILDSGHVSFAFGFANNDLNLQILADIDGIANARKNSVRTPEQSLFYDKATDIQLTVPASGFDFLGNPGDTIWAFPQSETNSTIFLGLNSEGVTNGAVQNDAVEFRLIDVDGPTNGHFSFFQVNSLGAANVFMNSGDGVDPNADKFVMGAHGHDHYFWAFTRTGQYRVSFQLAATNTSGTPITSRVYQTQFGIGELPGFRDVDGNGIDDHWEARHGFTSPADANADPDSDNKSNLQEYLFDTDPQTSDTNAPVFRITTNSLTSISLEVDTLEGRQYRLMYSDDLRTWKPGSEKILGQRARLPFLDDGNGLIQGAPTNRFYRLDISSPQ